MINPKQCLSLVITEVVGDKTDSNLKGDWLHGWQGFKSSTCGFLLFFPTNFALSSTMQIFLVLVKCHGRTLKVASQLVAEKLKKTKFYQNLCLAKQSNEEATLRPNCGKLARSFGMKFFHNVYP